MDAQTEITAVWEGHDDEEYRRDQSHWRGHGRWDDETWNDLGVAMLGRIRNLYRVHDRHPLRDGLGTVLEWGPGGGAKLVGLASHATRLYGVDISEKNLGETARQLSMDGDHDFTPLILDGDPSSIVERVSEPLDLFFSSAVFQHFPSKEYGEEVLNVAARLLAPGGLGYVQIRYDDGNPKYSPKRIDQYRDSHLYATSYGIAEFWVAIQNAGLRPNKVANINANVNYASFYFAKPKA